jgi:hypothetical protein
VTMDHGLIDRRLSGRRSPGRRAACYAGLRRQDAVLRQLDFADPPESE